mgnify:CR=1 FL=1
MRIDSASMGNVMPTEVPLVADVAYGLDDLTAAVEQPDDPGAEEEIPGARAGSKALQRARDDAARPRGRRIRTGTAARCSPTASRAKSRSFADKDAIIVHEAGSVVLHGFDFDPERRPRAVLLLRRAPRLGRRHRGGREARATRTGR